MLYLQPIFIMISHLMVVPSYYYLERVGYSELVGWLSLVLLVLYNVTLMPIFIAKIDKTGREESNSTGRNWRRFIRDKFVSVVLMSSLLVTLSYGALEGLLGVAVYRDRTIKSDPPGSHKLTKIPLVSQQVLVRITRIEMVLGIYHVFLLGWALWLGEWMVFLFYGFFAIANYWIGMISFMSLRYSPMYQIQRVRGWKLTTNSQTTKQA